MRHPSAIALWKARHWRAFPFPPAVTRSGWLACYRVTFRMESGTVYYLDIVLQSADERRALDKAYRLLLDERPASCLIPEGYTVERLPDARITPGRDGECYILLDV